mgnify:CR=1 FL=1
MKPKVLTIDQLAAVLGKQRSSIATDITRNPLAIPPFFKLPGSRKPLWLEDTVDAWLIAQARRANALPVTGKK